MILSILAIVISVALLIAVHEVGHLIAAKMSGIGVEQFSIGFGPAIIKKKIKETTYVLSLIPFGGYIKMVGEDFEAEGFYTQPTRKKVWVGLSGPLSNLVLGFIITILIFLVFGQATLRPAVTVQPRSDAARAGIATGDLILAVNQKPVNSYDQLVSMLLTNDGKEVFIRLKRQGQPVETKLFVRRDSLGISPWLKPVIGGIKLGGPAYKLGLRPGDEIIELAGKPISTWQELVDTVQVSVGDSLTIRWRQRAGTVLTGTIVPESVPTEGKPVGQIGVSVRMDQERINLFKAVWVAAERTVEVSVQTVVVLYKVVIGKISRRALGGPILMAQLSSESIHWGIEYFLQLLALLSINLFVINLLPIPVLDGGRVVIFFFETVRRKRLTKKGWNIALQTGWVLVLIIVVFVTFNDIVRIVKR